MAHFKIYKTLLIIILMLAFILSAVSCSTLKLSGDKTEELTVSAEEPDYSNATIGADIKGFIPAYLCINKENLIKIEITNTSDFLWRSERPNVVRIGYHYYGQDVDYKDYDKITRTSLPHNVKPGETVTINVSINDIKNKGTYVIQIDPVLEGNRSLENNFWFSSKGVAMLKAAVYFSNCSE